MVVGKTEFPTRFIHRGTSDIRSKFWNSLVSLSEHIPDYINMVVMSVKLRGGEKIIEYVPEIENVMGVDFAANVTKDSNVYEVANAMTATAQKFDVVRRLDAERLAGRMMEYLVKGVRRKIEPETIDTVAN
jgi:hypothetical protein